MALARQYVEKDFYTEGEYFALEEKAFERSEYVDGQIRMMSGGSTDHGAIASNVIRALGNALIPEGCRVYSSDVKVHCGDDTNTYPDVSVVCGVTTLYKGRRDVYTNPLIIVEVLSDSTEATTGPRNSIITRRSPACQIIYLLFRMRRALCFTLVMRRNGHFRTSPAENLRYTCRP